MGVLFLIASSNGDLKSSTPTALSNEKLDAVRYPFSGIECPTDFQRSGTGLRPEDNGTSFYQVYSCVKTTEPQSTTTSPKC